MPPAKKAAPKAKLVGEAGPELALPEDAGQVVPAQLADAAASQNPAVHYLIAKRHQHTLNGDADAVDAVTAELAELGYK